MMGRGVIVCVVEEVYGRDQHQAQHRPRIWLRVDQGMGRLGRRIAITTIKQDEQRVNVRHRSTYGIDMLTRQMTNAGAPGRSYSRSRGRMPEHSRSARSMTSPASTQ